MSWRITWAPQAIRDLRRLDRQIAERVTAAVRRFAATEQGDIKRLRDHGHEWRLRVGAWRVRFQFHEANQTLEVLRVLPRGRAYRD